MSRISSGRFELKEFRPRAPAAESCVGCLLNFKLSIMFNPYGEGLTVKYAFLMGLLNNLEVCLLQSPALTIDLSPAPKTLLWSPVYAPGRLLFYPDAHMPPLLFSPNFVKAFLLFSPTLIVSRLFTDFKTYGASPASLSAIVTLR